jgi:hypothetical protein
MSLRDLPEPPPPLTEQDLSIWDAYFMRICNYTAAQLHAHKEIDGVAYPMGLLKHACDWYHSQRMGIAAGWSAEEEEEDWQQT